MKKLITLAIISAVLIGGCLGRKQTVTAKSEKHGISVTGGKDDITVEGSIKLDEDTTIEFNTEEQDE